MAATMDSATQTSDIGSDEESFHPTIRYSSPRAVIDTSLPFNSVEEAVIRFGGRGFWVPPTFLDLPPPDEQKVSQESDIYKHEERDAKKDPIDLIMMELKQTKLDLYQNTNDLAAIRASVEYLSKKMEKTEKENTRGIHTTTTTTMNNDQIYSGGSSSTDPLLVSRELRELNYEAEQFMKTAESARSEVLKAMSEIEKTKSGLRVIEMRWVAAKKLEEAARAAESLALAEIRSLSNNEKPGRISLSVEEYSALTDKARKAESLLIKRKPIRRDPRLLDANELEFLHNECNPPSRRPTTSIADILSRKLVVRDELEVERPVVEERQRVSLNQMLCRQRGETTSPPKRREKDDGRESNSKHFFSRKAFGFIHVSLPLPKQSKSKIQALNVW